MVDLQALVNDGVLTDPKSARGRLLVTAARLFKEKGYERTTVRDLAAEVGIQSGSIFHHFRTKEEILLSVMDQAIKYNTACMESELAKTETTRDKVLALIRCELESINGFTGDAMVVLVYEWRSLSPQNQAVILKLRDHYEQLWMDVLDQAKSENLIQSDTFILRRFLTGALSWTTTWYNSEGPTSIEQLAEQALILVLK